ncbi:acyl-CoA dehydrogenase family protein, partial [Thermodesulfobacteriota bacterium]
MDFSISEDVQTMIAMINEFVDKELIPLEPEFLSKEFKDLLPVLEEKRQMVKEMELWGPVHPKEYGGMGLKLTQSAMLYEAFGRCPLGLYVFGTQAPDAGNAEI